jgi:pyridoxamine 5'-phosphate oxidase
MDQEREVGPGRRLRDLSVFEGELPTFDVDNAPEHPAELFGDWLSNAIDAGLREPHAMTLSTVDANGRPNSRVLLLKGLDDGRWQFASSRSSRKGEELSETPWAAGNFYWSELGRQVRLRGRVLDSGPSEAARDFLARSRGSRAASLIGNQSQPLDHEEALAAALREAELRLDSEPMLVPEHWALFHLIPDEVEFWQADPDRRHVRLRYGFADERWSKQRLWP